jgi:hypothetical protein
MTVSVKQKAEYSEGLWSWSVWLDGLSDELDGIEYVLYTLHRSYNKPLRRVEERWTSFRIDEVGFSGFPLAVEIHFKNGSKQTLVHELDLETRPTSAKPDGVRRTIRDYGTPKKILSIDNGGVRSFISIRILARFEAILQEKYGNPAFKLSDYFDYIGGTSTGAILAAFLSIGMSAAEVDALFTSLVPDMFVKESLIIQVICSRNGSRRFLEPTPRLAPRGQCLIRRFAPSEGADRA